MLSSTFFGSNSSTKPRKLLTVTEKSEALVKSHLGLAQIIAMEYANTPGTSFDELYSEACGALMRAAAKFDEEKGAFEPYAARAIRNALNTLFSSACRRARVFPESLDAPSQISTSVSRAAKAKEPIDPGDEISIQVRRRESAAILDRALSKMAPRYRQVIGGVRAGKSLSEVGRSMQMTKAGAHKILKPAIDRLRAELHSLGYSGLDSKGFLRSIRRS